MYHNCIAIAKWMKLKSRTTVAPSPEETARKAKAVSAIAGQWRELVRRRSAPGVGKRRAAGRSIGVPAPQQENVKRNTKFVRNARKLFLGVNVRAALDRMQPIGSSWGSEWDYG